MKTSTACKAEDAGSIPTPTPEINGLISLCNSGYCRKPYKTNPKIGKTTRQSVLFGLDATFAAVSMVTAH